MQEFFVINEPTDMKTGKPSRSTCSCNCKNKQAQPDDDWTPDYTVVNAADRPTPIPVVNDQEFYQQIVADMDATECPTKRKRGTPSGGDIVTNVQGIPIIEIDYAELAKQP